MADARGLALPGAIAAAALITWYAWTYQGDKHGVTLEGLAFAPDSYDAYTHWSHARPDVAFCRHFPTQMGPNCLPTPLQTQDGALSTSARNTVESPYG